MIDKKLVRSLTWLSFPLVRFRLNPAIMGVESKLTTKYVEDRSNFVAIIKPWTYMYMYCIANLLYSSDEGLTLEMSAYNHLHGVKLIHINLRLIHYTLLYSIGDKNNVLKVTKNLHKVQ